MPGNKENCRLYPSTFIYLLVSRYRLSIDLTIAKGLLVIPIPDSCHPHESAYSCGYQYITRIYITTRRFEIELK